MEGGRTLLSVFISSFPVLHAVLRVLEYQSDQPGVASAASIPRGRRFSRFTYPGLQNAEAGDSSLIFLFIPHESLT